MSGACSTPEGKRELTHRHGEEGSVKTNLKIGHWLYSRLLDSIKYNLFGMAWLDFYSFLISLGL